MVIDRELAATIGSMSLRVSNLESQAVTRRRLIEQINLNCDFYEPAQAVAVIRRLCRDELGKAA